MNKIVILSCICYFEYNKTTTLRWAFVHVTPLQSKLEQCTCVE